MSTSFTAQVPCVQIGSFTYIITPSGLVSMDLVHIIPNGSFVQIDKCIYFVNFGQLILHGEFYTLCVNSAIEENRNNFYCSDQIELSVNVSDNVSDNNSDNVDDDVDNDVDENDGDDESSLSNTIICYNCHMYGHHCNAGVCCHRCGKFGHTIGDCIQCIHHPEHPCDNWIHCPIEIERRAFKQKNAFLQSPTVADVASVVFKTKQSQSQRKSIAKK